MDPRRLFTALLPLLVAGCDGAIHVRGQVYTRSVGDTTPPSVALVDRTGIDTTNLRPLAGAAVTLFQRVRDTAVTRPDTIPWVRTDTTGADGSFEMFELGPPSAYTAALRIERTGYRTVTVAFRHGLTQQPHRAVVVLTPLSH